MSTGRKNENEDDERRTTGAYSSKSDVIADPFHNMSTYNIPCL